MRALQAFHTNFAYCVVNGRDFSENEIYAEGKEGPCGFGTLGGDFTL